ncbi:MAG: hypothetical protein JRI61_03460, partial [Deltaproteobacteria bacterium]|nr:hypothetical protein [Deltaproteobacteria bacterium]
NVRELQNILEHALILCQDNMIEPEHLSDSILHQCVLQENDNNQPYGNEKPVNSDPDITEREKVFQLLENNNWHRGKTAKTLGIDRTTLWRKMKRLGLKQH